MIKINSLNNVDKKETELSVKKYDELSEDVESSGDEVERIEKPNLSHYIGHVDNAHPFSLDNEFIINGYRINFNSCGKIVNSLCMCHNETVNVWTHLVGALFTVLLIVVTFLNVGSYGTKLNKLQINEFVRNENNFENYSDPFFQSKPYLHNTRLILNRVLNDVENWEGYLNKLEKSKQNFLKDFNKIILLKTNIQCKSCVEDYIRNLNSIERLLEEIKNNNKNKLIYLNFFIDELENLLNEIKEKIKEKNKKDETILKSGYYYKNGIEENEVYLAKWPISIQLISAIICLSCSSSYHLLSAHSSTVQEVLARLDYAGISILIAGSCYPPYYYMFYCSSFAKYMYLTFISTFAMIVFLISLFPNFADGAKRKLRGFLFLALGVSAGIPVFHILLFNNSISGMIKNPDIALWVVGGLTYISGCLIYIFRIPERKFPGKFDYIGNSHQIWHIFVLGGIIFHHFAAINSYNDRLNHECTI